MNAFLMSDDDPNRISTEIYAQLQSHWWLDTKATISVAAIFALSNLQSIDPEIEQLNLKRVSNQIDYMLEEGMIAGWNIKDKPAGARLEDFPDTFMSLNLVFYEPDNLRKQKGCCD